MDINDFKSTFSHGVQKTNRYRLSISPIGNLIVPNEVLMGLNSVTNESVETVVIRSDLYGSPYKGVGYVKTDGEVQLTFILDGKGIIRKFFSEWQDLQHNKITRQINYKEKYISPTMLIQGLSKDNERVITTDEYRNVFPSKVSGIIYASDNSAIVPMITVTLEFEQVINYTGDMSSSINSNSSMDRGNRNRMVDDSQYTNPFNTRTPVGNVLGLSLNEEIAMNNKWGVNGRVLEEVSTINDILGKENV